MTSISNRFPDTHTRTHAHTHTNTHDESIRKNTMRCVWPTNPTKTCTDKIRNKKAYRKQKVSTRLDLLLTSSQINPSKENCNNSIRIDPTFQSL